MVWHRIEWKPHIKFEMVPLGFDGFKEIEILILNGTILLLKTYKGCCIHPFETEMKQYD